MILSSNIPFPLRTDSYKLTHWKQYPPGTTEVYSYLESRGGMFNQTVFFGLQYYLQTYLSGQVVTHQEIDRSVDLLRGHFPAGSESFNTAGWRHIVDDHQGRLPVEIKAVPEGTRVDTSNVLMTIRNTCPRCFWLTNVLESLLLKVWYPTTVATLSYHLRQALEEALVESGEDRSLAGSQLQDFGYRGASSEESAALGAAAHLISFTGSDTLIANWLLMEHYGATGCVGHSIPASEHSTITSWGRKHEIDAYRNILTQYKTGPVSIVSDSYDIYAATEHMFGDQLRDLILDREGSLVIRPDSGDPVLVLRALLRILNFQFGSERNEAGKILINPKIKLLWGDGMNYYTLRSLVRGLVSQGYAASNFVFGMGGALLQQVNRDTQKFAFKCSNIVVDGKNRPVFKDPVTDPGKASKQGRLALCRNAHSFVTLAEQLGHYGDHLQLVFRDGQLLRKQKFDQIQQIAAGLIDPLYASL